MKTNKDSLQTEYNLIKTILDALGCALEELDQETPDRIYLRDTIGGIADQCQDYLAGIDGDD